MFTNMSNQELILKKNSLENEYEVIKKEIDVKFQKLNEMEHEYANIEKELERRRHK